MQIKHLNHLQLSREATFDQERFLLRRQRLSGCGPTAAASLAYYLSWPDTDSKPSATQSLALMERMWEVMTPSLLGLFNPQRFERSFRREMASQGMNLKGQIWPVVGRARRLIPLVKALEACLAQDMPIPFLHLTGANSPFETWHWVSLLGLDPHGSTLNAEIFDNGRFYRADLASWLRGPRSLGAFVLFKRL